MEKGHKVRRWFVLLCAHMSMVIFAGTYRSLGVFLVEWKDYFNTTSTEISAIITVLAASGLLSGIPSGIVITRYGCHYGSLLGGIAFVSGTVTSVFAPNPLVLCFTMGFVTGLGIGAVRNSAVVAIAQVFKKGFSRANGIALAGASIGMMLVPPLLQLCIDQYGWRGALLILVGIQMHLFIVALIFRPPQRVNVPEENQTKSRPAVRGGKNETKEHELEPLRGVHGDNSKSTCSDVTLHLSSAKDISQSVDEKQKLNTGDDMTAHSHVDTEPDKTKTDHDEIQKTTEDDHEIDTEQNCLGVAQSPKINGDCEGVAKFCTKEIDIIERDGTEVSNKRHGPSHEHSGLKENELLMNLSDEVRINEPNGDGPSAPCASNRRPSRLQRGLHFSGLSLFCNNVGFCLLNLCQIMIGLCYTGILTHLVASAVYDGIDQQSASFLLSVFGIGNLIVRLASGWLVELHFLSPEHLYVLAVVAFGATMIVSRAWSSYEWYVVVAILFGLSSGLFRTLDSVVLKRYVGMKYFARAIGVFYAFSGVGDLIGPVFAGALYDASNSYDLPFYVGGSVLIVSSGLLLLEPPLRRLKERRQARSRIDSDESAV
ncbi:uncharacterized protein LOC580267 isoform X1 [Strongylocentrotus purpuratus]|uniref:Major facilitator superfamily (MFS) profile domain-containing protein n=1 Tax=Strongylocentrotus purpuratus TaxID=7668 RepID=A0A7M7HL48_STRPU|nr:uncharacterized protein LOC580267 isoform X1 [Strongylocentrotus purpuratus]